MRTLLNLAPLGTHPSVNCGNDAEISAFAGGVFLPSSRSLHSVRQHYAFPVNTSAINFDQIEWESPQPGMRCKVFTDGSRLIRLVEFSEEFVEAHWCEKAHVGFVLSGELDIDFSGHVVRFPEGSALSIPPGSSYAHKARAVTPIVRLFLVEDIST